jgi:hypothetical protein
MRQGEWRQRKNLLLLQKKKKTDDKESRIKYF